MFSIFLFKFNISLCLPLMTSIKQCFTPAKFFCMEMMVNVSCRFFFSGSKRNDVSVLWIKQTMLFVSLLGSKNSIQSAFMQRYNWGTDRSFPLLSNYTRFVSRRTHRLQFPLFQESHRGGVWCAITSAEKSEASKPETLEQTDGA